MAFNVKKNDDSNKVYFDMKTNGAQVDNVRAISETTAVFTLKCTGFSFYNLKVIAKKDNPHDYFIGIPATKGKDGNYYNNYGLYLTDEDRDCIITQVLEKLDAEN